MKRDPSRPKASDITDQEILDALEQFSRVGFPFPSDAFKAYPGKVVAAKLAKAQKRGWSDSKHHLTKAGREALRKLEEVQ